MEFNEGFLILDRFKFYDVFRVGILHSKWEYGTNSDSASRIHTHDLPYMDYPFQKIDEQILELLHQTIRTIPDHPVQGIQFKDITPLLKNRDTLEITKRLLARPLRQLSVDYVVGLESRGFLFGTSLAQDLHSGFVPVRKPKKLPAETISVTYDLEYGTDSVEMHTDAIEKGSRVVIHDDLIATGGTAKAATELVNRLGGIVVGYSFILEIEALNGRDLLQKDVSVYSLLKV